MPVNPTKEQLQEIDKWMQDFLNTSDYLAGTLPGWIYYGTWEYQGWSHQNSELASRIETAKGEIVTALRQIYLSEGFDISQWQLMDEQGAVLDGFSTEFRRQVVEGIFDSSSDGLRLQDKEPGLSERLEGLMLADFDSEEPI